MTFEEYNWVPHGIQLPNDFTGGLHWTLAQMLVVHSFIILHLRTTYYSDYKLLLLEWKLKNRQWEFLRDSQSQILLVHLCRLVQIPNNSHFNLYLRLTPYQLSLKFSYNQLQQGLRPYMFLVWKYWLFLVYRGATCVTIKHLTRPDKTWHKPTNPNNTLRSLINIHGT